MTAIDMKSLVSTKFTTEIRFGKPRRARCRSYHSDLLHDNNVETICELVAMGQALLPGLTNQKYINCIM